MLQVCKSVLLERPLSYEVNVARIALPLEWAPTRPMATVGQSGPPPRPEELPPRVCPPAVRNILGTLLYAVRVTRFDLS